MDKNTIRKIYGAITSVALAQGAWGLMGPMLVDAVRRKDRRAVENALREMMDYMISSARSGRLTAAGEEEEVFRERIMETLLEETMAAAYGKGDMERTIWGLIYQLGGYVLQTLYGWISGTESRNLDTRIGVALERAELAPSLKRQVKEMIPPAATDADIVWAVLKLKSTEKMKGRGDVTYGSKADGNGGREGEERTEIGAQEFVSAYIDRISQVNIEAVAECREVDGSEARSKLRDNIVYYARDWYLSGDVPIDYDGTDCKEVIGILVENLCYGND